MTLVSSGAISIGGTATNASIEQEINGSTFSSPYTSTASLNDSSLRSLAGVSSGAISMSNFYGKSSYKYQGTITQGYSYTLHSPAQYMWTYEYGCAPGSFGSRSPTTLVDGKTMAYWVDHIEYNYDSSISTQYSTLIITGFSSNPGIGYVTTATVGTTSKSGSSASYGYPVSGQAVWTWTSIFGFGSSGTVSVSIK